MKLLLECGCFYTIQFDSQRDRFLGYFAESAERIELAKIKEKLCSTHLETFFKTRNLGFGFPIRHHRNAAVKLIHFISRDFISLGVF